VIFTIQIFFYKKTCMRNAMKSGFVILRNLKIQIKK
jgi:hypothetical protein